MCCCASSINNLTPLQYILCLAWRFAFHRHKYNFENIAAALINLNRTNEAIVYLNETDKDSAINKNKRRLITHYESYGDLHLQQNNIELAQLYFTKGLELAKSNNRLEAMEVFYRKLSKCFYRQNKYKEAYDYFDLSKTISDTLLNAENSRQVNEMSAVYETAEKESRIGALHTENEINLSEAKNRRRERNFGFQMTQFRALDFIFGSLEKFV